VLFYAKILINIDGDSNLLIKVLMKISSEEQQMAISPNPDRNIDLMCNDHGTKCLITDYGSEKYLKKSQYAIPEDRYSRPCGGSHGFDDYVERWHE